MMYVAPNEQATKRFSHDYLSARFASPPLARIITKLSKNDVYVKEVDETKSNIILTYACDDANRTRGPATDQNVLDEVQGINLDVIPIVNETMAISQIKREIYAGTPLTTDNTINVLWQGAHQMEWVTRCDGCNHWNSLTEGNEPLKMIQKKGLSCSKCGKLIDTNKGLWVDFNPGDRSMQGFHLAQPMLPYYNQTAKGWLDVYEKCFHKNYSELQVYNEVLGLPFDIGAKPITEEELKAICILGPMNSIYARSSHRYQATFMGVDWGVSAITSRTVCMVGGLTDNGVVEIFHIRIFKNVDYETQIREIARIAGMLKCMVVADCGPDPIRGKMLGNMYDTTRTQLARYTESPLVQYYDVPTQALDWSQARWCLNRSETMGFTMAMLKQKKILFPRWEDSSEAMQDILAVFTEVTEENLTSKVFYRHKNPDDSMHALNYLTCAANLFAGNSFFSTVQT
jgi:hypothetical protein